MKTDLNLVAIMLHALNYRKLIRTVFFIIKIVAMKTDFNLMTMKMN
jgi:hypothetical protein